MDKKRLMAGALSAVMMTSVLSGCGNIVRQDATKIDLVAQLTKQEVLDYYAKAMNYDTVVSRAAVADINNYEVTDVTDTAKITAINNALDKTETMLKFVKYTSIEGEDRYLTESMYNYIRALLNDKELTDKKVVGIKQALGYYFVDVEYKVQPSKIGEFTGAASLVGMNGSFFKKGYSKTDAIDQSYLTKAVGSLNRYFASIKSSAKASFNNGTKTFVITDPKIIEAQDFTETTVSDIPMAPPPVTTPAPAATTPGEATPAPAPGGVPANPTDKDVPAVGGAEDEVPSVGGEEDDIPSVGGAEETPVTNPSGDLNDSVNNELSKKYEARKPKIDLGLFSKIVGDGQTTAYIPSLPLIYTTPPADGNISGIGLYPSGSLGLSTFGFDRDNLSGTCTLRYVYKEDLVNPRILSCENIYTTYYEITSGFNASNDSIVPEFLQQEFSTLLERADRAMVDCNIAGLMNGNIFSDMGMAVLRGYEENYGNLLRQISTVRRIISRDIENNSYLIEVESYRQEGAESADVYASYKDQVYAVIEQQGSKFVITDWMIMNRQLVTEPDINPDAATDKRIVSLGLTGEIADDVKRNVMSLIDELYKSSSSRILNGAFTMPDGTAVSRGMYDCFNSNVEMLPSTKKEELNSKLRTLLVKYGVNTGAKITGKVTEWIGGSNNQVEFTTEEVIQYQGRTTGTYMTCYYLVSSMEDTWVIDDIQILSQEEISGEGLQAVVGRIG